MSAKKSTSKSGSDAEKKASPKAHAKAPANEADKDDARSVKALEERVYDIGMMFLQISMKARVDGDIAMADRFEARFFELCEKIQTKPLSEAARIVEDDIMLLINKVNTARLELEEEKKVAFGTGYTRMVNLLNAALNIQRNILLTLTKCLETGTPPPKLLQKTMPIDSVDVDESLKRNELSLRIFKLTDNKAGKKRQYRITAEAPCSIIPQTSTWFRSGVVDQELKFIGVNRSKPRGITNGCITLTLAVQDRGLMGKVSLKSAGTLEVPLRMLGKQRFVRLELDMGDLEGDEKITLDVRAAVYVPLESAPGVLKEKHSVTAYMMEKQEAPAQPTVSVAITPEQQADLEKAMSGWRQLEEWEFKSFCGVHLLQQEIVAGCAVVAEYQKLHMPTPQNIADQLKKLAAKRNLIQEARRSGKMSDAVYKNNLTAQIAKNQKEISYLSPDSPKLAIYQLHNERMTADIATIP